MPLGAIVLKAQLRFVEEFQAIDAAAFRAMRREMREKAILVTRTAKRMVPKRAGSSPEGQPFHSHRGVAKKLLGYKLGHHTAFVGFRKGKGAIDKATGRRKAPERILPNVLEHGARHMKARPVLEPALERAKDSPFRARL